MLEGGSLPKAWKPQRECDPWGPVSQAGNRRYVELGIQREVVVRGEVSALLIFRRMKPFSDIPAALEKLAIPAQRAQTLAAARRVLSKVDPPLLAFTERELPDGNWADVLSLSEGASSRVSVIVVAQEIDTNLYASAIELGALDFIAPPFDAFDLAHVVRCAADNALARRKAARNWRSNTQKVHPIAVMRGRVPEQGI